MTNDDSQAELLRKILDRIEDRRQQLAAEARQQEHDRTLGWRIGRIIKARGVSEEDVTATIAAMRRSGDLMELTDAFEEGVSAGINYRQTP